MKALMLAAMLIGARGVVAAATPPDAPRAATSVREQAPAADAKAAPSPGEPVELRSVSVRALDEKHRALAGERLARDAAEPLTIEIETQMSLPTTPTSSSPVIVLNGERLMNTWVLLPDRLVAFLPDRTKLKPHNAVVVEWVGNATATRSRKPLTFTDADVGRPQR